MDEIRFSRPQKESKNEEIKEEKKNIKPIFKKLLKVLGGAVILAVVIGIIFLGKDFFGGLYNNADTSKNEKSVKVEKGDYSAVFLSNGQVYFGKMTHKDDSEIVLTDVFYLQLSGDDTLKETKLNETKFSLIKLGNELHGPTDKLYIITSQVLFYESLREDSRVVQAIQNYSQ